VNVSFTNLSITNLILLCIYAMEYAKISQSLATTLASNQMKYFAVEGVLIWLNQNFGYVMEFVRAGKQMINDTYWKCPDEEKCISSEYICNSIISHYPEPQDTCFYHTEKSRKVCENPDKFNFNLNCTSKDLIFCPGNKT